MGYVVERTSRGGRVQERYLARQPVTRVGRGYGNEMILADPYAAAEHVVISNDLQGLSLEVLSDEAATQLDGQPLGLGRTPLTSGAELLLGRTHLRIYAANHPVAPVLSFERLDQVFSWLTRPLGLVLSASLFVLITATMSYLSDFRPVEPSDLGLLMASSLAMMLGWAALWSVVTRISRGEPRFFHHLLAALAYLVLTAIFDWLVQLVAFNTGALGLRQGLEYVATGVSLAVLLSLSLRFAFSQGFWPRQAFAQGIAWSVVGYTVLSTFSFQRDFNNAPDFDTTLLPAALHISGAETEAAFVEASTVLFDLPLEPAD